MIYGQIQMGVYYEAKQEKNADKTLEEIKDIVYKNLDKDPIYYTKNGQFGVDVGYTDDNVALGEPVEPKGEYKSSGYGKLKENKLKEAIRYKRNRNRRWFSNRWRIYMKDQYTKNLTMLYGFLWYTKKILMNLKMLWGGTIEPRWNLLKTLTDLLINKKLILMF